MPKDGYLGHLVEQADTQIEDAIGAVNSAGRVHGIETEDVAYSCNQVNRAIMLRNMLKDQYDASG